MNDQLINWDTGNAHTKETRRGRPVMVHMMDGKWYREGMLTGNIRPLQ